MNARQGTTLFGAVCAFIATLVIIQLWLLSASFEAFYDNEPDVLLPATIASAVLFAINVRLVLLAIDTDRKLSR